MQHREILKQYFGYDFFRQGQEQLIDSVLGGRDVLGIMPTGAGKSICFQVPALVFEGITLIISPLISLMKDQVNALTQSGIAAAFINSSLTERQVNMALENAKNGAYKLIYIAPERLLTPGFLEFTRSIKIAMLTVDEAHCISQWGQDFRPSYGKIPEFIAQLPQRPIVSAFTATATPKVRADILALLNLQSPDVLVTGFDRQNLYFEVQRPKDKLAALLGFLQDKKGKSGIVYCSTRKGVEEVCETLQDRGFRASRYHAGLSDRERQKNQEDFLYDRVEIMVATNAFGMGIDKSNVSFVVHFNMPKDVESYYQEAGRAGRDGEQAHCLLLYSGQDVRTNLWMIENSRNMENVDSETEEILKERDRKRLKEMTFYATTNDCLRGYILNYFGEKPPNFCGNCGSCNTNFETIDITHDALKILDCVGQIRQRYGAAMVVDVLQGSKNEKVLRWELDKLPVYGTCKAGVKQLREMINYLILNGFLLQTNDQYPVIQLGEKPLAEGDIVTMNLAKPQEKVREYQEETIGKPVDKGLLTQLKQLRQIIADEQKVPSFIIFSNSTLTDMCMKQPTTPQAFLAVSGVGKVKLERYGPRFFQIICQFLAENRQGFVNDSPDRAQVQDDTTAEESDMEISDNAVTISTIADRINSVIIQSGRKKISGQGVNEWLLRHGYLEQCDIDGQTCKYPTEKGKAMGIICQERTIRGRNLLVNQYEKSAQQFIIDQVKEGKLG